MASSSATQKAKKYSRDPLVSAKQKIFEVVQSMNNQTQLTSLLNNDNFKELANSLVQHVPLGDESVIKDQNKAESYIASGCAIIQRKQARKPKMKDFEEAAALIHKGLMLMPSVSLSMSHCTVKIIFSSNIYRITEARRHWSQLTMLCLKFTVLTI